MTGYGFRERRADISGRFQNRLAYSILGRNDNSSPGGKPVKHYAWIAGGALLAVALALGLALILPPDKTPYDFIMLYSACLGIIHHTPLYDNAAIIHLTITQLHLTSSFTVYPYPYPPWYALGLFYLAFLPLDKAINAWMLLNAAMLLTAALLLTAKWKPLPRILAALAALLFIPSLGLIVVGQYSAPVLLGAALFMYAAQREDAPLTALGLLLMTFKPHLGLFLIPAGSLWLLVQKTPFARRAVWMALGGGLALAAFGFLADPVCPLAYVRSLVSYTTISGVTDLGLSAGFSAMLVKMALGQGSFFWSAWLSIALVIGMLALFWRFKVFTQLETLVIGCVLLTLLGDPYLLNYDYILLLLPLAWLVGQAKTLFPRVLLGAAYLLPWLNLSGLERGANIFYAVAAIFLVAILLQQTRKLVEIESCN
jgi:hypothetical protein